MPNTVDELSKAMAKIALLEEKNRSLNEIGFLYLIELICLENAFC